MDDEQTFLVEAQKERDQQVAEQGVAYEPDPAIQEGIDQAMETPPEIGSGEPGFLGLGGLSKSEVEAQKAEIAQREDAVEGV